MADIRKRKKDHLNAAVKGDMEYSFGAGFGDIRLIHNALPEIDFDEIDTSCALFGRKMSAPIIFVSMTGGYPDAEKINLRLAEAAEQEGLAFGLGSQRAMIEKPELAKTYKVRKVAPSIPIIGNIGGCQLAKIGVERMRSALDTVEADALAIHVNPLQELCQPEGDSNFKGVLGQIGIFCKDLGLPVIVKETGAGISYDAAEKLKKAGVKMIDIAGAGGTSWSREEYARSGENPVFADWGNPTCECIASCSKAIPTIGSGGVRNGLDAAKAIALGADFAGAALPFLRARKPGEEAKGWKKSMKIAMLLTGSKNIARLKMAKMVITGKTAESFARLGICPNEYAQR